MPATDCFWGHATTSAERFPCIDGTSVVCARCCVGERFARAFLEASGCRAVMGYRADVAWLPSMLTDLRFFQRFYAHADPWAALRAIHASVQRDFRPARALGHALVVARG